MRWFRDLDPPTPSGGVVAALLLAGGAVIGIVALRVFAGGWFLGLALLGAVALWELGWEQPRRRRLRRALIEARQAAAGTQPLLSETGKPHWSDALPRPLAVILTAAPNTLLVIAILIATSIAMEAFGNLDLTAE
ncbi:MAG: hypothetical protein F4Z77_05980 [Dehalococcoidia bacterium]|nr:hypothetical protein [Dehalococcoidia bacterium]MYA51968.1 hypothetical protein [Dehalococcoidia bacterium]